MTLPVMRQKMQGEIYTYVYIYTCIYQCLIINHFYLHLDLQGSPKRNHSKILSKFFSLKNRVTIFFQTSSTKYAGWIPVILDHWRILRSFYDTFTLFMTNPLKMTDSRNHSPGSQAPILILVPDSSLSLKAFRNYIGIIHKWT